METILDLGRSSYPTWFIILVVISVIVYIVYKIAEKRRKEEKWS